MKPSLSILRYPRLNTSSRIFRRPYVHVIDYLVSAREPIIYLAINGNHESVFVCLCVLFSDVDWDIALKLSTHKSIWWRTTIKVHLSIEVSLHIQQLAAYDGSSGTIAYLIFNLWVSHFAYIGRLCVFQLLRVHYFVIVLGITSPYCLCDKVMYGHWILYLSFYHLHLQFEGILEEL